MLTLRPAHERGSFDFGWLRTSHTFSFGDYRDAKHMGFRALRVINDDVVAPGQGFGEHPHQDMEIITVVLSGSLAHRDSIGRGGDGRGGNIETISPGEVQRMSAGRGIFHSEFNASKTEPVHLLQIWIRPSERGIEPGYAQKRFDPAQQRDRLALVVSPDGRDGSLSIHQDASLYLGDVSAGASVSHELGAGRHAWVHVATGSAVVNGQEMKAGDGLAVSDEQAVTIQGRGDGAKMLVFDLA